MKKRGLVLCLSLALYLSVPAVRAVDAAFSDVPAGSWFEKGVATCSQEGVMVGLGNGAFSPDTPLTAAECLTLAVRLYDLRRGGDGTLESAPEDWGKYTLTLADGTTFTRWGEQNGFFSQGHFDPYNDGRGIFPAYVLAPGDTAEEREAWAKTHEGPATFTAEGKTYSGAVVADSNYDGPLLRFACEEEPHSGSLLSNCKPGPNRWYRDAAYTVEKWGLSEADGFSSLLSNISYAYPDSSLASREGFARALATAAGEMEKRYDVAAIPDLERREYTESIYCLYEAGILNGKDSFGTFWGDKDLTRAECAVMVARVLDPGQRLTAPPAVPSGYEQAVIDLRTSFGYYNEKTFETPDCTVFVFDRGGMMHAPHGWIKVIYKAGSSLGDGYALDLPSVRSGWSVTPADTMELSADQKTFTYSYFYDTTVWDSSLPGEDTRAEPGTFTFTVDLPTGEIHREYRPVDYAGALAHVTRRRIVSSNEHSEDREVVQTLEAPECTVVLTKGRFFDDADDYILSLVYKPGSALGDGTIKRLLLPTTVELNSWYNPTDRPPDSLIFSEDGTTLTYTYHFDEALEDYHEAGVYTYTVDLATGELSVTHTGN